MRTLSVRKILPDFSYCKSLSITTKEHSCQEEFPTGTPPKLIKREEISTKTGELVSHYVLLFYSIYDSSQMQLSMLSFLTVALYFFNAAQLEKIHKFFSHNLAKLPEGVINIIWYKLVFASHTCTFSFLRDGHDKNLSLPLAGKNSNLQCPVCRCPRSLQQIFAQSIY